MSTLSVRFPDSAHNAVKKYIETRGQKGSKEKYLDVLNKAPHIQSRKDDVI